MVPLSGYSILIFVLFKSDNFPYFDLSLKYDDIKYFFYYAKKLKDNFCALGPRFLNVKEKSHKQIDKKLAED